MGLGFGAIQAGLFVYEAQRTGAYAPPLVVDVRADLVAGMRAAGGRCRVNIARADRIDVAEIGPLSIADATVAAERAGIIDAIAAGRRAQPSLCPSVAFYRSARRAARIALLAEALATAHGAAATGRLLRREPPQCRRAPRSRPSLEALEPGERDRRGDQGPLRRHRHRQDERRHRRRRGDRGARTRHRHAGAALGLPRRGVRPHPRLAARPAGPALRGPIQPGPARPSRGRRPGPVRGRQAAGPQRDARAGGLPRPLAGPPPAWPTSSTCRAPWPSCEPPSSRSPAGRSSPGMPGPTPLFTPSGFAAFADDLLARMVNPFLADTIERAARDPRRKLAWDDRFIGLIRLGSRRGRGDAALRDGRGGWPGDPSRQRSCGRRRRADCRRPAGAPEGLLAARTPTRPKPRLCSGSWPMASSGWPAGDERGSRASASAGLGES